MTRAIGGVSVASSSRVHDVFRQPRLPDWGLLDILVSALASRIRGLDPSAESQRFHGLWEAAAEASTAMETPDSSPLSPVDPASPEFDTAQLPSSFVNSMQERIKNRFNEGEISGVPLPVMQFTKTTETARESIGSEQLEFPGWGIQRGEYSPSLKLIALKLSGAGVEPDDFIDYRELEREFIDTMRILRRKISVARIQLSNAGHRGRISRNLVKERIYLLNRWGERAEDMEIAFSSAVRDNRGDILRDLVFEDLPTFAESMIALEHWSTTPLQGEGE
ncbi:hypothetical protein [Streptomyces roseolus]